MVWLLAAPLPGFPYNRAYDQIIHTTAQRHGIDPALVKAVIQCESQFNPLAQSPRGAQGLMQLMPATQTLLGVRDAFDPQDNVEAGVSYLAMLQRTFPDNLTLVLAAYNAGPQAVVNAGYSVPPFVETQRYVQCVLQAQNGYGPQSQFFPRRPGGRSQGVVRGPLIVRPLHLSRQVARPGKLITMHLEASHTGPQPAQGVILLYYPAHLVSFVALHSNASETAVHTLASPIGASAPDDAAAAYQILRSPWPAWHPGQRRRAVIALIPQSARDLMLHLSVVLEPTGQNAAPPRWGAAVRIPVRSTP
jgi:hypothetical protein